MDWIAFLIVVVLEGLVLVDEVLTEGLDSGEGLLARRDDLVLGKEEAVISRITKLYHVRILGAKSGVAPVCAYSGGHVYRKGKRDTYDECL